MRLRKRKLKKLAMKLKEIEKEATITVRTPEELRALLFQQ